VLALADLWAPSARLAADGFWDAPMFRRSPWIPGIGRRMTTSSELVIGGLWSRAPTTLSLELKTRTGPRALRFAANDGMVRGVRPLLTPEPQTVTFEVNSSAGGDVVLRTLEAEGPVTVFVSRIGVAQTRDGPARLRQKRGLLIPARRLLLYAVIGALVGWSTARWRRPQGLVSALGFIGLAAVGLVAARFQTLWVLWCFAGGLVLAEVWRLVVDHGWADRVMPSRAATVVAAIFVFRVALVLHPGFHGLDTRFHIAQAQLFASGAVVDSMAPGVASAWYPPSVYAVLSRLLSVGRSIEQLDAIANLLAVCMETGICLLVYLLVRAGRGSRTAAGAAAAVAAVIPEGTLVIAKAILSNIFGSLVGVATLVAVLGGASGMVTWALVLLVMLSHVGAGMATLGLLVLLWTRDAIWGKGPVALLLRRVALVAVLALVAWALYYREVPLILATGPENGDQSTFFVRWYVIKKLARDLVLKFGLTPLILAVYGLGALRRQGRLWDVIVCWVAVGAALLTAAVLTPWPLRGEYFLAPAVAVAAGFGAERLIAAGRRRTLIAALLVPALIQIGLGAALVSGRFAIKSVVIESPRLSFSTSVPHERAR
jgi:hypothetical protein